MTWNRRGCVSACHLRSYMGCGQVSGQGGSVYPSYSVDSVPLMADDRYFAVDVVSHLAAVTAISRAFTVSLNSVGHGFGGAGSVPCLSQVYRFGSRVEGPAPRSPLDGVSLTAQPMQVDDDHLISSSKVDNWLVAVAFGST